MNSIIMKFSILQLLVSKSIVEGKDAFVLLFLGRRHLGGGDGRCDASAGRRLYQRRDYFAESDKSLLPRRATLAAIDSGTHHSLSSIHTHPGTDPQFCGSRISYIKSQ